MGITAVRMTEAEFAALPDDDGVKRELVDGELCEMASGGPVHETVKGNVLLEVAGWIKSSNIGARLQSETRYYLTDNDIFQPDVSVVLRDTLDPTKEGKITICPDLAVEVVSSESADRLNHKINCLLAGGTRAVVVCYPSNRQIYVHRAEGIERLPASGTLRLDDVLPGFAVPVGVIFEGI